MDKAVARIATHVGVPTDVIEKGLRYAHTRFRKIHVKKRSGGTRTMIQPAPELKLIQAWVSAELLQSLPVSSMATAFEAGCSIVKNAKMHADAAYSVRVDIKEFFPSIKFPDLYRAIRNAKSGVSERCKDVSLRKIVRTACFDVSDSLPIGYMTSPHIANIVMFDLDQQVMNAIAVDKSRFGTAVCTRYADDFIFSTDKRGACREFVRLLEVVLARCKSPQLTINSDKTRYMSRAGGSTLVTGMRVKPSGEVGIHSNYRDHLRLLLKLFSENRLKPEDKERLRGHLAFVQHADPSLFTRLAFRYHDDMAVLLK